MALMRQPPLVIEDDTSNEDIIEAWARRAILALQEGEKDLAEELLIDILCVIGRNPAA